MNVKFFDYIAEAIKHITSFCDKAMDEADGEHFTENVRRMSEHTEETYQLMRRLIEEDTTLSTDEKLKRLKKIAQSQERTRQSCGESIIGNREHVMGIVKEIFWALTTCGLSYAPKIITMLKQEGKAYELETETIVTEGVDVTPQAIEEA